ncbi:DeoR/GlpR family DNA-binding transcription regulator [Roseovarius sp. PS-C2]|uniref:DeoR/GlpR family DNA-binding transcription regulator n=1 Tax=Roseovarius sp. PS-C2 TaxID=2820814 RepID=UPI001C0C2F96|nr:DeoR/GlpR family DNA-binding transcription regulator [Roseovarius sp. PS-C2]MBU3260928.1 DeoR/GlpR family DNA-binding transcription regulator [Roseovarius sp. PS-C2]
MWSKERHRRILAMLETNQQISAGDLAQVLGVSRETVRRDLVDLESDGTIDRVHGGAVLRQTGGEAPFEKRRTAQTRAKRDIARKAAALLVPGCSIFVDAGTTTSIFGQVLAGLSDITVITNSFDIANTIQSAQSNIDLFLLGGQMMSDVPATFGELTLSEIRRFKVDTAFIAPVALDSAQGVFSYDLHEAEIARAMLEQANETVLLVDHTKMGQTSRVRICDMDAIDSVVTDNSTGDDILHPFRQIGIRLVT